MRFVIDMNLGLEWIEPLERIGYAAVHWSSLGHEDAPDDEIMRWARAHDHVVLTADLDFAARLVRGEETAPSVVQLRTQDTLVRLVGDRALDVIRLTHTDLAAGAIVTVEPERHRVRRLTPQDSTKDQEI